MVWVKGGASLVQALAARSDVSTIRPTRWSRACLTRRCSACFRQPLAPAGIEPNISYVHADQLWDLGFTGQGMVIGAADTGVQWDHPALQPHYRGWNGSSANHDYNWHDSIHDSSGQPCGNDSPAPCDDYGHGTHTTGTAVGDDGPGNQIGVAPGANGSAAATWTRATARRRRYMECFEFFLAPYPVAGTVTDGDPGLAPDMTTNSWTCPLAEGCADRSAAAAIQAAAGGRHRDRGGGRQLTARDAARVAEPPSILRRSVHGGRAGDWQRHIAGFSGRGPVTSDGSNRRKPDISAPGTNVRSSTRDNGMAS